MKRGNTRFTELVGKKINSIEIIDVKIFHPSRKAKAKIICPSCHAEAWVNAQSLERGKIKSCGCRRYAKPCGLANKKTENLQGKTFGKLKVIKIDENKNRRVHWICQCECGNTKSIPSIYLKSGESTSCGCKTFATGRNNPLWQGYEEISGKQWSSIKQGAARRNLNFSISIEDAWKQFIAQNMRCALSGVLLDMKNGASLDRIDSNKGYEIDNIQWLHKKINVMKWDLPQDEFLSFCKMIVENCEKTT